MWHLLVVALARDGRRIEAVRACDRLESILATVGMTVSSTTRELRQRVLADDLLISTPPLLGTAVMQTRSA